MSGEYADTLDGDYIAQSQNQKEATANAAFDRIAGSIHKTLEVDCSAGGTITVDADDYAKAGIIRCTGTVAGSPPVFDLVIPDKDRHIGVINDTDGVGTLDSGGGDTVLLQPDERAICVSIQGAGVYNIAAALSYPNDATKFLNGVGDWVVPSGGGGSVSAGAQIGYAYTADATLVSSTGAIQVDNTIPQNTEGAEYTQIATTINVQEAASLLEIEVALGMVAGSAQGFVGAIFKDSDANALVAGYYGTNSYTPLVFKTTIAAGSTGNKTFKFRYGSHTGTTIYINGEAGSHYFSTVGKSQMTVREIKQ